MSPLTVQSWIGKIFDSFYRGISSVGRSMFVTIPYLFSAGPSCKEVTEQYPDPVCARSKEDLPARTRGRLYNDIDRCTGCKECENICPTHAIFVGNESGPEPRSSWVATFDIDLGRCIFCQLCVDVCVPMSLFHTKEYEIAVRSSETLVLHFGKGSLTLEQREKWRLARQYRFE